MSNDSYITPEPPRPADLWREDLGRQGTRADRILFCGDIHDKGKRLCPLIERAADRVDAGTIVLLGDLLNEWGISSAGEVAAFEYLATWVERQRGFRSVAVLLGNHDLTYYVDSGTPNFRAFAGTCPGFNPAAYPDVHYLLHMMKPRLMFGFTDAAGRGTLASHAGLTHGWYEWMWERLTAADEPRPESPSGRCVRRRSYRRRHPPVRGDGGSGAWRLGYRRALALLGRPDGAGGRSAAGIPAGRRSYAGADRPVPAERGRCMRRESRRLVVLRYAFVDAQRRADR